MPVSNAPLDILIAKLKAPEAVAVQDIDPKTLAAGLEDLRNRMSHVEHAHLKVLAGSRGNDDRLTAVETKVGSIEQDRDEMRKTVKTSTDLPIANGKRVDELEARVRAVEGAVGAAPYKEPKKIEPEAPAKTGWFGTASTPAEPAPVPQPA